jgi:anthranilate synthase/aminodeoxychorismate synthase-like glutamine amidotransferase
LRAFGALVSVAVTSVLPIKSPNQKSKINNHTFKHLPMVLLIDNYDSFVHNLARYVRELGEEAMVCRNDALTLEEIARLAPAHIILSPGPCTPAEAGISTDVVRRFGPSIPILGVCLGHQCIGAAYGGEIVRATRPMHGKTSAVIHDASSVFAGLPSPLRVTRYHSLVIAPASVPPSLRVIATSRDDGEIMAVEHRTDPVVGVQFHPESAATEHGYAMLDRFLRGDRARTADLPPRADGAFEPFDLPPADDEIPRVTPPPVERVH